MRLDLEHKFTIEVGEDSYDGVISEPTKSHKKEMQLIINKDNLVKKELKKLQLELMTLNEKLKDNSNDKLINQLAKLTDSIEAKAKEAEQLDTNETLSKYRIKNTVKCGDEILNLCEVYGYSPVLSTIIKDLEDRKK